MSQNALAVLAEVAEQIKGSNTLVRKRVVDALVEKEVASRAELLDKSLAKLVELDRGLKKLKPDVETVDVGGAVTAVFSKKAYEERKKSVERKEALEKAIEAALEGSNEQWGKLREALQKAGSDKSAAE